MPVREGFLEEAMGHGDWKGTEGGCLQLGPGKSIPGRRNSRTLRLVALCRPGLPEPALTQSRGGQQPHVTVQGQGSATLARSVGAGHTHGLLQLPKEVLYLPLWGGTDRL